MSCATVFSSAIGNPVYVNPPYKILAEFVDNSAFYRAFSSTTADRGTSGNERRRPLVGIDYGTSLSAVTLCPCRLWLAAYTGRCKSCSIGYSYLAMTSTDFTSAHWLSRIALAESCLVPASGEKTISCCAGKIITKVLRELDSWVVFRFLILYIYNSRTGPIKRKKTPERKHYAQGISRRRPGNKKEKKKGCSSSYNDWIHLTNQ